MHALLVSRTDCLANTLLGVLISACAVWLARGGGALARFDMDRKLSKCVTMESRTMPALEDPDDSLPRTTQSPASAAFVAKHLSGPRPDAGAEPHRVDEQVMSEKALDEALEMTFPASDPVAL
jgi:hypothetical protein